MDENDVCERFEQVLDRFGDLFSKPPPSVTSFEYRKGSPDEVQLVYIHELLYDFISEPLPSGRENDFLTPKKKRPTRSQTPRRHASFMKRMSTWMDRCENNIHPLILKLAGYLICPKLACYTDWTAFTYSQRFDFLVRLSKIL
jgi:hypothetical protein